jgi:hypothetical protein
MAARLGLDPKVWQLCEGINKEKKRFVYFHNIISKISFHALPPDEYNFPSAQQKGIVANNLSAIVNV